MPPGIIPNPTKKKLRPSSAAANLQTHPSYSSGLFDDNVRPTTGSATKAPGPAGLLAQRPKTQASGPRYWGKPAQPLLSDTSEATQRRLTVGHVEGIAGTQPKGGRPFGHKSISNFFMGKVNKRSLSHWRCTLILFDRSHNVNRMLNLNWLMFYIKRAITIFRTM